MKALLKQTFFLLGSLILIYALILGLVLTFVPRPLHSGALDTAAAAKTIFMTEPKYVFLNRGATASPAPKLILLGASNVVVGFRQPQLQQLVRGMEVHNLAIGGSNMTQCAQVVDLVQELQSPAAKRNTRYVIGIWYGQFAENRVRWNTPDRHAGDTDIDIERYRYGFSRRTKAGPVHVLPPDKLDVGVTLILPYLALDRFAREGTKRLSTVFGKPPAERTDEQRNATVVSDAEKVEMLKYWDGHMQTSGLVSGEQFVVLSNMIEKILQSGSHVLIVDLPIPRWHEQRSPYYASYQMQKKLLMEHFSGRERFSYFDKLENNDLDFSDEVHPKPRIAAQWASRLAKVLEPMGKITPDNSLAINDARSGHE